MRQWIIGQLEGTTVSSFKKAGVVDNSASPHTRLRALPLEAVTLGTGFWGNWQSVNRKKAIPEGYSLLLESGVIENFLNAAAGLKAEHKSMRFADTDLYKWLEAAAYEFSREPDDELADKMEAAVKIISDAQRDDGYIDTFYQVRDIEKRWKNIRHDHELYCAGHLIQAAVAHFRATGLDSLLSVARKFADHIDSVFGPDKLVSTPGHPEIEMALVELYRVTGADRYLNLARFFVDERGKGHIGGAAYYQDHVPVRNAQEVAGHAVRQMYLECAKADLYLELGDRTLLDSTSRLWNDMVRTKMSITGGIGARHDKESFGEMYELPNDRCYNETCAQIGSVMWNWRMLLVTGETKYADLLEWTLYNGVMSGTSLNGTEYFYDNPLMSRGKVERSRWFRCACCPPNWVRLVASIHGYLASSDLHGVQLHLYENCTIHVDRDGGKAIDLRVDTKYPWEETVRISVSTTIEDELELSFRIPGWCESPSCSVNGIAIKNVTPGNYCTVRRTWEKGDSVELTFPMTVKFHESHPYVEATRNCAALTNGPIVYCFEAHDQVNNVAVEDAYVNTNSRPSATWEPDLLGGVVTLAVDGELVEASGWTNTLYRVIGPKVSESAGRRPVSLKAIPYFAWANRGPGQMRVWMPAGR